MKKILYTLLLLVTIATTFTACTEEVVEPKVEETTSGTGGSGTDPIGKP
jgi:hypothetical protein